MRPRLNGLGQWVNSIEQAKGDLTRTLESHFGSLTSISEEGRKASGAYIADLQDKRRTGLLGFALEEIIQDLPHSTESNKGQRTR